MEIKSMPAAALPVEDAAIQKSLKISSRAAEKNNVAAKKVAREFETMFVGMMLKSMRETVGKDKLTGGGHGEEVYRSLLDQEYAKASSEGRGIGLAGLIEKELLKTVHNAEKKNVASPNDTASALNERSAGMAYQALESDYRQKP